MILTADLHLRTTKPRARIDDYFKTQEDKFNFILQQAVESPPLLVAGDFFDRPKPGEFLISWVIERLKFYGVKPIIVPGQHDMPYHSLDRLNESGLGVLAAANVIDLVVEYFLNIGGPRLGTTFYGAPFGTTPPMDLLPDSCNNVLIWHHMVIDKPLWPGQVADMDLPILIKYNQFNLIVTGDNHTTFSVAMDNKRTGKQRHLVNPGSMMRMTSAQADHRPCMFKWENGRLEQIFLQIRPSEEVFDLTMIGQEKERDARIKAFVERLHTGYEVALSFEKNMDEYLRTNQVDDEVKKIIWEACG